MDPLSGADKPGYTTEAISRLRKWPLNCTFTVGLTGFECVINARGISIRSSDQPSLVGIAWI